MSQTDASSTKGGTTQNCTDYTTTLLPQHVHLGVDAEGYRHHLDRATNSVWRFEGSTVERRTPLGAKDLDRYLAFVADEIGWQERYQIATWDIWGRE